MRGCWVAVALSSSVAFASSAVVGTFTQSAGASQVVPHALGMTPKGLIVWSTGQTVANSAQPGAQLAFGLSDGATDYAMGTTDLDNSQAVTARRVIAPAVITFESGALVTQARATVSGWNATSFTLVWSTNDGAARRIHYLLIGGADVSAKAITFLTGANTGPQAITGVGFRPDVVLSVFAATAATALPSSSNALHAHLSAASLTGQWTLGFNVASGLSNRYFSLHAVAVQQATPQLTADLTAMGPDGYTLSVTQTLGAQVRIMALALEGPGMSVGLRARTVGVAPFNQPIGNLGFPPEAVMLATGFAAGNTTPTNARGSVGAATRDDYALSALRDFANTLPTNVNGFDGTARILGEAETTSLDAARVASFDPDGFTLEWLASTQAMIDFGYFAVGVHDAGVVDAGVIEESQPRVLTVGCNCQASSGSGLGWLLGLGWLARLSRKTRAVL